MKFEGKYDPKDDLVSIQSLAFEELANCYIEYGKNEELIEKIKNFQLFVKSIF